MNPWLLLAGCIVLEVTATSLLKASDGFSRPLYGYASLAGYGVCFWLLSSVMTKLPVGVVYAVWSGVGIVGVSLIGWLVFRQHLNLPQLGFIALILIGAVGLNLTVRHG
jgi:small multidrug resistance pump